MVTTIGSGFIGAKDGNTREAQFNCPISVTFDEFDYSLLVIEKQRTSMRRIKIGNGTFYYFHFSLRVLIHFQSRSPLPSTNCIHSYRWLCAATSSSFSVC